MIKIIKKNQKNLKKVMNKKNESEVIMYPQKLRLGTEKISVFNKNCKE